MKVLQPFELEADMGIQELKEQATIQVELLDASDGKICVEFSRVGGSSSLFYQQFNMLYTELSHYNNVLPPI